MSLTIQLFPLVEKKKIQILKVYRDKNFSPALKEIDPMEFWNCNYVWEFVTCLNYVECQKNKKREKVKKSRVTQRTIQH